MTTLTIDPMLMADLSATCNSLGYLDDATGKYQKEPECIECVKDLVRFLRRDDENHEIRRALGETKVVVKDLIPIIKHHSGDVELLDVTLRLLVNLTTPALILYEEELPGERVSRRYYMEVIQYLQAYKEAFSDKVFWEVLAAKMTTLLEKDWESRMEDDRLVIERIMILVRNVLHIPANPAAEKRTDDDASVHDQVLWAMHLANLDDIILYIAQSDDEQHLCMHVLEVVSLMLREQDAKQLARSGSSRSHQEREKDIRELDGFRKQELEAKQKKMERLSNLRHTRFGGTFTVKNMRSISDRALIYHQPLSHVNELSFDKGKVPRKTPKNRLPLADGDVSRRSMLTIRLFLKQFCSELLEGAYNKIMYNVKDDLARAKAQAHDESYYMWAVKFFMEFNRYNAFKLDRITETLSVSMFHYLQTQLESYLEMMAVEKRKIGIWSKRAHLALRAYQELLFTIQHMDGSAHSDTVEAARVLKSNLFYMPEYRELLYVLLCKYDPVKMSRKFLTDLIETTHVFIKLLERFSGGGRVMVKQKRKAKRKSKPKRTGGAEGTAGSAPPPPDPELAWDALSDELSAAIQGDRPLPEDVRPFDAASEVPLQEQRTEAMLRIQDLLRTAQPTDALALLRAAREVWPEGDAFGAADIAAEDEFLALREIHFAELPGRVQPEQQPRTVPEDGSAAPADESAAPADESAPPAGQSDEGEDEEEEETVQEDREQEFDFKEFIKRFMSPKVLEPYCRLLHYFDTNTPAANHCVLKMLHRVAWDHQMAAMLFQVSLFRTFQRLMDDPRHCRNPAFKELIKLAKFILRKFFEVAATNKKVFMELLFWKTPREAYEAEHGYDTYQDTSRANKVAWSEEEEDELARLYEELRDAEPDPGRDLVDRILGALICRERSRRQVIKKLKSMGLVEDTRQLAAGRRRGVNAPAPEWTEQEVDNLTELWNRFKNATSPVALIWDNLTVRRPKNRIRQKLVELGLAERSQLVSRVQRVRRDPVCNDPDNFGIPGPPMNDSGVDSDISDEGEEEGGGSDDGVRPRRPSAPSRRRRSGRRQSARRQVSPAELAAAVTGYMQSGGEAAGEVLSWLQESLQDLEELRGDDPDEPVPLVPLTEASAAALESEQGQRLISLLGAQKPGDGEMFWRWPPSVGTDTLVRNIALLADCLAGNGPPPDDTTGSGKENVDPAGGDGLNRGPDLTESSEDEEPRRTGPAKRSRLVSSDEEGGAAPSSAASRSQEAPSGEVSPLVSGPTSQRRRLTSDSEGETPTQSTSGRTPSTQRSRVSRVTSDSEGETPTQSTSGRTPSTQRSRVSRVTSGSEGETPTQSASGRTPSTQRSRVSRVTSDSEGETPTQSASGRTPSTQRSRVSRVTSDSEGETPTQSTSGRTPSTQRSRVSRVTSDSEGETPTQSTSGRTPSTQRSRVSRVTSGSEGETPTQSTSGRTPSTQRSRVSRVTSDSEGETPTRSTSGRTPSTQRSRVSRVTSDSEGETPTQSTSARTPSTQRSRVSRVTSDSESEDEEPSGPVDAEEAEKKRLLSSDEGDSDLETRRPAGGAHKKARRVIDSDSD